MIDATGILNVSLAVTMAMLAISLLLIAYRVWRGPSLPDRVVGLDMLNVVVVGVVAVDAILNQDATFLPAALVLALLAFVATVAFAEYIHVRARHD
jgi:multicomponent Na+:H+ antiporter subunit F